MKNLYSLLFNFAILSLISFSMSKAQEVGSFDYTFIFNGESRTVSCYVPNDYNSANEYSLLVGLHGAGDNSVNYRNVLINTAQWQNIMPNTIFIFPDGGSDQSKDFYTPQGDESVIDSVINYVKRNYNVNSQQIYLQGFSLGGRSALIYGLAHPDKVFGLLLHTPAMQSPYDVQNYTISTPIKYENAPKIPISICHGDQDIGFLRTIKMLTDSLVSHNSKLLYVLMPELAHSIPPNQITEMMHEYLYVKLDEAIPVIHRLYGPIMSYDNSPELKCRMRNLGEVPITSMTFEYTVGEVARSFDWTGNLTRDQYIDITLPKDEYVDGAYMMTISVSKYNDQNYEPNLLFNQGQFIFNVSNNSVSLPFKETFADPNLTANYFAIQESGNFLSWMPETSVGKDGNGCMLMLNTQLAYYNFGLTESMLTTKFDYSKAVKPFLEFDVAYNYSYYLPPYVIEKTNFTDTLQILMSNDDWKTSSSVFKKWGDELQTFSEPLENPLEIQDFLVIPTSNDWKKFEIDLSDYEVSDKTMFKIDYISGSGGVIFFDNFHAYDKDAVSVTEEGKSIFNVYPNPVSSGENIVMTLTSNDYAQVRIDLYDNQGQKVSDLMLSHVTSGENSFGFTLPNISSGVYYIKASYGNFEQTAKLIVR
ncbi:MAG: T9SS type A sorting domain-containing protein [Candidatus Kapabacteria bacterium]|nr:T9SS type A sorting domain-containing protein [Candidatus Kapabacteria bacterium]